MSKIRIKNFGPIKEGYRDDDDNEWIEVNKVTVFIGNQASGKSTVAKLISSFTWLEKALFTGVINEKDIIQKNNFKDTFCHYHRLKNYFKINSEIEYKGSKYSFHYFQGKLKIIPNGTNNQYFIPKIMYVPAERNFLSVVEEANYIKGLPRSLYEFLKEYDRSLSESQGFIFLPIGNFYVRYQKFSKTVYIGDTGPDYEIRLLESSSGLQSLVPLYLVSLNLSSSIGKETDPSKKDMSLEEEKRLKIERQKINEIYKDSLSDKIEAQKELTSSYKRSCFINIIEEPEQNLFPSSQKQILNSLLKFNNLNESNELIMTTHSPYIINYLALAVKANKVLEKAKTEELRNKLNKIVPFESTVNSNNLVIYELDDKGNILKLEDYKGLPSDENYLNVLLSEGNQEFTNLLEIEDQCQ